MRELERATFRRGKHTAHRVGNNPYSQNEDAVGLRQHNGGSRDDESHHEANAPAPARLNCADEQPQGTRNKRIGKQVGQQLPPG